MGGLGLVEGVGMGVVMMVAPKSGITQPLDPQLRARISALEGI